MVLQASIFRGCLLSVSGRVRNKKKSLPWFQEIINQSFFSPCFFRLAKGYRSIRGGFKWMFPKIGGKPRNGWFIMETSLKWMIWRYHYFWKHLFGSFWTFSLPNFGEDAARMRADPKLLTESSCEPPSTCLFIVCLWRTEELLNVRWVGMSILKIF